MRYRVTTPTTTPRAVKRDFASSLESLTKSLDDLYLAYDAVVAAEGRVIEAEECLNDCHEALESIKRFGVNEINMSLLNKDNILNDALGMESLALEAISKLADADKKLLQSKYVSSLTALEADSEKGLVQKIKDVIAKIWNWLKEWFVSDAKLVAMLKECKFDGEFDSEKKIVGVSKETAQELVAKLKELSDAVTSKDSNAANNSFVESLGIKIEKENATASELHWTPADAVAMRDKLIEEVKNRAQFKTAANSWLDEAKATAHAQISNSPDSNALQRGAAHGLAGVSFAVYKFKLLNAYKKFYNTVGFTLLALSRVCKQAEAK